MKLHTAIVLQRRRVEDSSFLLCKLCLLCTSSTHSEPSPNHHVTDPIMTTSKIVLIIFLLLLAYIGLVKRYAQSSLPYVRPRPIYTRAMFIQERGHLQVDSIALRTPYNATGIEYSVTYILLD